MRAGIGSQAAAASVTSASTVARYEALIRVSEALRAYHDRDALFRSLARELRPVVQFSFLGLALYDEGTRVVKPFVLEATGEPMPPPVLSDEEQLTYWVVDHQQPLLIPDVTQEQRFPQEMAYLQKQGIVCTCSLPLITPRRRVGMLITGSREPHVYDEHDVTFFSLFANQVALAVDDAQNYGALAEALRAERDRQRDLEASDELLRALAPILDIREVFPRISEIAATVIPHDLLTLIYYEHDTVIVEAASRDMEWLRVPRRLRDVDSVIAQPHTVIDELAIEPCPVIEPADMRQRAVANGFHSMLIVRVLAHEQHLALEFWARKPAAFDRSHLPIARRIADHVGLCVSHQQLAETARRAAENRMRAERLQVRLKSLSDELDARTGRGRVVGASPEWQAVLKRATQVADTDTTVLLEGESGTGKEVVARYIHRASKRHAGPFVAINCAALPEQLLESELFGYERGAFTGAQQSKPGQIELAAGGVLFLDEVSEMSAPAQAKFLRVLQEREFQRLGGTRTLRADVRVVAATNRDLRKAIERGDFREDLYYRLQVFDIKLPSLRVRRSDIVPLSEVFLEDIGRAFGRPPAGLTREAKDALLRYHWPGNVRELHNALERAAILCEGGLITAEHLSLGNDRPAPLHGAATADSTDLNAIERELIARVLAQCGGNKSMAATRLGLTRTQLYVRLRKHRLT